MNGEKMRSWRCQLFLISSNTEIPNGYGLNMGYQWNQWWYFNVHLSQVNVAGKPHMQLSEMVHNP